MHLLGLSSDVLVTAPCFARMKRHPEYQGWGATLVQLSDDPGLAPFRTVLRAIVQDALDSNAALSAFLRDEAAGIDELTAARAGNAARNAAATCPPAALVLAYVALCTWARGAEQVLYAQIAGAPPRGWLVFPYNLAYAGARAGAYRPALRLIEHAYDVISARRDLASATIVEEMNRYRALAHECAEGLERSIQDLADEMRDAAGPDQSSVRAEVGAILWTLGLVPHSLAFQSGTAEAGLPTRRLARDLVRRSMERIDTDRLLQYVWLELKNNGAMPIRDHEGLFAIINYRFADTQAYTMLGAFLGEDPGPLYARTLVGWFRGTLTTEEKARYIAAMITLGNTDKPLDLDVEALRMYYLSMSIGQRSGWPWDPPLEQSEVLRLMRVWTSATIALRRQIAIKPEFPDPQTTMNLSLHELLERELGQGDDGATRAWDLLEEFRSSALGYWMTITPPRYPDAEIAAIGRHYEHEEERIAAAGRADDVLFREEELLRWLRGAYFSILYPILPFHFRRYAVDLGTSGGDLPNRGGLDITPERSRQEFADIKRQLKALHLEMQEMLPGYAGARLREYASWDAVTRAAAAHRASNV